MISWKLNNSWDVIPITLTDGLISLEVSKYPDTNAQLVPLRLFSSKRNREYEPSSAIDWDLYLGESNNTIRRELLPFLPVQLENLIGETTGVTSVDLSKTTYNTSPSLSFNDLCFTIDCKEYTV